MSNLLNYVEGNQFLFSRVSFWINKFNSAVNYFLEDRNIERFDADLFFDRWESAINLSLLMSNARDLIRRNQAFNAYKEVSDILYANPDKIKKLFGDIDKKYLTKERKKLINLATQEIKQGKGIEKLLDDFNSFVSQFDKQEFVINEEDIPFLDAFDYECEELRTNDWGKCILVYDTEDKKIRFVAGKINEKQGLLPCKKEKEFLRKHFANNAFISLAGYHKHLLKDNHIGLGGGAYMATSKNKVFVDYYSQDYGPMQIDILRRCLDSKGYRLSVIDERFFSEDSPIRYLQQKIILYD